MGELRHNFASCLLQEVWHLRDGQAFVDSRNGDAGFEIVPDDGSSVRAVSTSPEELAGRALPSSESFMKEVRSAAGSMSLRIRWCHELRFGGESNDPMSRREYAVLTASSVFGPVSAVADLASLPSALALLREQTQPRSAVAAGDWAATPLLWLRGTAGVLFHEAIGHPAEREKRSHFFPSWLEVHDEPRRAGLGELARDDAGHPTSDADLRAESPRSLRRSSYRQPSSRRLTNVVCFSNAEQALVKPERYLEITGVAGGEYDPAADRVTLSISCASVVDGEFRSAAMPFRYSATRREIAASLRIFGSEIISYPGVLCSDDGQTLPVGTFAPELLTDPLRS